MNKKNDQFKQLSFWMESNNYFYPFVPGGIYMYHYTRTFENSLLPQKSTQDLR